MPDSPPSERDVDNSGYEDFVMDLSECPTSIIIWSKGHGPMARYFTLGRGVTLRLGSDVTLVGTGMMSALCLKAAELLAAQGVDADVLHMGSIKALDDDLLRKSASRTRAVVTAENASMIGGLGSAVAESLGEAQPTVVLRIGVKDRYVTSGRIDELLAHHKMNPSDIAEAARQAMGVRDGNLRNVH